MSATAARLLLVEDTDALARSLQGGLAEEGFTVEACGSLASARAQLASGAFDGVILDLGLPDGDGTALLSEVRGGGHALPIIVLTARDAMRARVTALECGADDYLLKPFAFEELLARLRALLRRASAPRWSATAIASLSLRPADPVVTLGDRTVVLSPRERGLLGHLCARVGTVVTRRELLREVFGYDFDPGTNLIDVHVAHLRRKLVGASVTIETVRGFGYRLRPVEDP